jgi:hypothetical protein
MPCRRLQRETKRGREIETETETENGYESERERERERERVRVREYVFFCWSSSVLWTSLPLSCQVLSEGALYLL